MGVQLTCTAGSTNTFGLPTCQKVNISGYTGIQFWARSTSNGGAGAVFECKLPYTPNTNCDDPINGTLDKFDDYAVHLGTGIYPKVTSTWTKYTLPFTAFAQAGWGTAVAKTTVLQNASQIQWQSDSSTASYFLYPSQVELEVDDIQLYY